MIGRAFGLAFLSAIFSLPSLAETDLSGIWVSNVGVADRDSLWPTDLPYTEEGLAAQAIAGTEEDPAFQCIIGFGRIMSAGFPTEIIQTDKQVTVLYEYNHQVRRIYTDGRQFPKKVRPTLMGYSIGKWEGDTLVVETIAAKTLFFRLSGVPYSEEARVTERISLLDDGESMEILIEVDDPKFYTEAWNAKKYMKLDNDAMILEYDCTMREHLAP
jgi:hypothetical protein